jgi:hypothetical protein
MPQGSKKFLCSVNDRGNCTIPTDVTALKGLAARGALDKTTTSATTASASAFIYTADRCFLIRTVFMNA